MNFCANTLTNVFTDVFGRSVTNATSVTITNRAYVHDANGNLTGDGVFSYAYDAANQLTNVVRTADGARVLSARYDALGRRVEAIRGDGSVERYVYFPGSFLVLAVLDGSNAVKEIYTRGPDLSGTLDGAGGIGGILACTYASGATYCPHADIMGNVIALTDASGSVAATFRYTPFGQLSARTGSLLPRYLFSSKEFDRPANLYYYGYRYYAPRLGRWMTRDPIKERGGYNLYEFCGNNSAYNWDGYGLVAQRGALELLAAIRFAKAPCECCTKVLAYLECLENEILANDKELRDLLDEFASKIGKLSGTFKGIDNATSVAEFLFEVADMEKTADAIGKFGEIIGPANGILKKVASIANIGNSVSRSDILDLLLTIGTEFDNSGVLPILNYYLDAYRTALEMISRLQIQGHTASVIQGVATACSIDCNIAESLIDTPIYNGKCRKVLR